MKVSVEVHPRFGCEQLCEVAFFNILEFILKDNEFLFRLNLLKRRKMSARPQCQNKQVNSKGSLPSLRDALYISSTEKTFANDELLPSLPVPSLSQTIEKYLDSVKPLVAEKDYLNTKRIAEEFVNGIGKELHEKLIERSNEHRNWLEKWWEELAYLSQRTPLLPLCSMMGFTNMADTWPPLMGSQIPRAALYIYFQMQFWKLVREERLKPHSSRNVPWSMHQFRKYYNTVRIPGEVMDKLKCYFHTESEEPTSPTHLIVMHKGHIFSFDAIDEYGDVLLPPEIELQLQRITNWCSENGPGSSVGSLTVDDRTTWAKNREWLLKIHPENELHMETIDTALFVFALDDAAPVTLTEYLQNTMGGDSANRWADKSITSITNANGTVGVITDHSPFDGLVPVVAGHFVYLSISECGGSWKGPQTVERDLLPPRRLEFHLDEHIKCAIAESRKMYQIMVDDADVFSDSYTQYGKSFLKNYSIHPETYAQFALHLAYYTMHGRPAPTYVTAATRQFYHGRTETMRSCFPEVLQWVRAMVEDQKPAKEKFNLMLTAAEKFKTLMKDCSKGHGCDRHLLGLYMISVEEEMAEHPLFTDDSWKISGGSGNFVLSTSCSGYTLVGGGVMPMKENGYGTFYNIENHRFTFTITAFNRSPETDAAKLFRHIERALTSMQHLLISSKL